jgi:hypothetical protein
MITSSFNKIAICLAILIIISSIALAIYNGVNYSKVLTALPFYYYVGIPLFIGLILLLLEFCVIFFFGFCIKLLK